MSKLEIVGLIAALAMLVLVVFSQWYTRPREVNATITPPIFYGEMR